MNAQLNLRAAGTHRDREGRPMRPGAYAVRLDPTQSESREPPCRRAAGRGSVGARSRMAARRIPNLAPGACLAATSPPSAEGGTMSTQTLVRTAHSPLIKALAKKDR